MKIDKVTFISAQLPYWNLVTHAVFPEYGMPLVATIVRNAGYDVKVFVEQNRPYQVGPGDGVRRGLLPGIQLHRAQDR